MSEQVEQDTYLAWTERAAKELKGKPLDTLDWISSGGLQLKPYYSAEERKRRYPVLHTRAQDEWDVYEAIEVHTAKEANLQAHRALEGGASGLRFVWNDALPEEIPQLLAGIELPFIQTGFCIGLNQAVIFAEYLAKWIEQQGFSSASAMGYFTILIPDGGSVPALAKTLSSWFSSQIEVQRHLPGFRSLVIDGALFGNAGMPAHQELGLVLAWYGHILENTVPPKEWQINLSFGPEFYTELCKFRIIAHLSSLVGEKYGYEHLPYLFGSASDACLNDQDRYTNLLRLSTSAMSAVMGGANGLVLKNFSHHPDDAKEFVARITRNCQLVLQHESKIGKAQDPASGSYFYEKMSFKLAEQAWDTFLEIQEKGGILDYLNAYTIVEKKEGTVK
ncbi:MAG: methylmalonyl-CoA mutase family protein [Bacteroidia bacterium]